MTRALRLLAAGLVVLALTAAAPRASYTDIEDEVMCVTCNVALTIAESPQAEDQKDKIRELVADGRSKDEILDELVAIYGPNVLAEPEAEGFDLAAYAVPAVVVLGGLALAIALIPRWRRRPPPPAMSAGRAGPRSDADAQRLDDDLARYDR